MDLVSACSSVQQAKTAQAIQTSVARKTLDAQRQEGAGVLKMLAAASKTSGGGDALAAAATGLGGSLDVTG